MTNEKTIQQARFAMVSRYASVRNATASVWYTVYDSKLVTDDQVHNGECRPGSPCTKIVTIASCAPVCIGRWVQQQRLQRRSRSFRVFVAGQVVHNIIIYYIIIYRYSHVREAVNENKK